MQVVIKGSGLEAVKEKFLNNAVDYFKNNYKYGGFMYENFELEFLLPYSSKRLIKTHKFFKEWEYTVDLDSLLFDYIFKKDESYFGKRDLETAKNIWVSICMAQDTGGELILDTKEITLLDDIIGDIL